MANAVLILLFGFGMLRARASAESPVGKVGKDGSSLFIGRTIHLLAPSADPLIPWPAVLNRHPTVPWVWCY